MTFLTEAISLSTLRNPLYTAIKRAIISSIAQVSNNQYSDDLAADYRKVFIDLRQTLADNISKALQAVVEAEMQVDSSIQFGNIVADGTADGIDVTLNVKYIQALTKGLVDAMAHQAKGGWNETLASFWWEMSDRETVPVIRELIGVLIHELVHVKQVAAQIKAGRIKREYRSYAQPDKAKFDQVMKAIKAGTDTDADYVAYRASPQEIAAFAHQIAIMFIDQHDQVTPEIISRDIDRYIDRVFDIKDKKQRTAFNRLHKMLYNELINYADSQR